MKLKKIINIFGGPGIGKSTIAAGLFYKMKVGGYNVEYVSEYAKELTYDDRTNILESDQLYIFAKQHRKILRLKDKVEYIITDSPLLLSSIYLKMMNCIYDDELLKELILNTNSKYNNLNILLIRNETLDYKLDGRLQDKNTAIKIDELIKKSLDGYITVLSDNKTVEFIYRGLHDSH